ncbi:prepilin-type N-terminal cleavage/methylation domain-containing protein [Patescibacteria group bacterium]|nr:prepilin-type N-terminal cleavage/methylation domain-containing protein [Patescibacteria group bacterium]MBU0777098.1 prepilin-type N-terminal cleavage/methylation domain-containing protein [Patescibacteria group bacterium]MBU0845792.1 prepilin-type N-terminal cleavage/methylation domain-containing protein [Patescibacteria group bacterium]MBU0922819.1 prepilin-type N-terminal cleavage/methylation domain-containing protein [Patescibacteria group bacterium]MBU1066448.1 prepilin-type N-terminal
MLKPAPPVLVRQRKINLSGYTLIEILVGMSIIGLIFSFGYISYRDFARRQALVGSARRLKADLSLAQEQALSGKKPASVACSGEGSLNGYDFFVDSATSYIIQANCIGGLVEDKAVEMTSEISLTAVPNRFTFKVIGKGTSLADPAILTLTQTATGNTQVITVSPEGEIK